MGLGEKLASLFARKPRRQATTGALASASPNRVPSAALPTASQPVVPPTHMGGSGMSCNSPSLHAHADLDPDVHLDFDLDIPLSDPGSQVLPSEMATKSAVPVSAAHKASARCLCGGLNCGPAPLVLHRLQACASCPSASLPLPLPPTLPRPSGGSFARASFESSRPGSREPSSSALLPTAPASVRHASLEIPRRPRAAGPPIASMPLRKAAFRLSDDPELPRGSFATALSVRLLHNGSFGADVRAGGAGIGIVGARVEEEEGEGESDDDGDAFSPFNARAAATAAASVSASPSGGRSAGPSSAASLRPGSALPLSLTAPSGSAAASASTPSPSPLALPPTRRLPALRSHFGMGVSSPYGPFVAAAARRASFRSDGHSSHHTPGAAALAPAPAAAPAAAPATAAGLAAVSSPISPVPAPPFDERLNGRPASRRASLPSAAAAGMVVGASGGLGLFAASRRASLDVPVPESAAAAGWAGWSGVVREGSEEERPQSAQPGQLQVRESRRWLGPPTRVAPVPSGLAVISVQGRPTTSAGGPRSPAAGGPLAPSAVASAVDAPLHSAGSVRDGVSRAFEEHGSPCNSAPLPALHSAASRRRVLVPALLLGALRDGPAGGSFHAPSPLSPTSPTPPVGKLPTAANGRQPAARQGSLKCTLPQGRSEGSSPGALARPRLLSPLPQRAAVRLFGRQGSVRPHDSDAGAQPEQEDGSGPASPVSPSASGSGTVVLASQDSSASALITASRWAVPSMPLPSGPTHNAPKKWDSFYHNTLFEADDADDSSAVHSGAYDSLLCDGGSLAPAPPVAPRAMSGSPAPSHRRFSHAPIPNPPL
ncbi:hypothetical protein HYH03_011127 [Edaphochlamys debaryana]|uniref:Uncharacterized protein n=1 Tax=Edaphochlamys debaryana TaxID=47281 RepID=A0A835Y0V7_9CHLO|nr:hypothetical protein HYH03_011127 [Edaphochlamys debaryana]|eukprot:KAG2490505.1 hypothetical protein HYH03_011127 [Edaphochlamys debaryana]